MPDVNELIKQKLKGFPANIYEVAIKAIELSESTMSEVSIVEQLENIIRLIIKKKGV